VYSRGNNWGYGCHAPSADGDFSIDLSLCNRIKDFDAYHGTITVEPGVSYGELARFLKENGDQWIAPVHGGGPNASVLGNAVERGYGITPHADHFGAVISLTALMQNGELYQRPFKILGLPKLDKLFKYGLGPYYDGLFTQSGIGIVTEITIRLAAKQKYVEMFYFQLKSETDLAGAVEAIKLSKRELGSLVGGINLINTERCLSMVLDYPLDKIKSGASLSDEETKRYAKEYQIPPWLIVGMLYGEKKIVKAAKAQVKDNFRNFKKRSIFFNSSNQKLFLILARVLEVIGKPSLGKGIKAMSQAFDVLLGTPNNVALKLAYWKNENKELVNQTELNPNRDDCGLIWYAPLVEMKGEIVTSYVQFIRESAKKFDVNSLITLTTVDDLCFDSTIPILFNQKNKVDTQRALEFYDYLLDEGRKKGFFPYRLSIESQKKLNLQNSFLKIPAVNPNRYK
jgi:4-cresol dehydrogenase (hydroxylating)